MSASAMAITGGRSDHNVPVAEVIEPVKDAASINAATTSTRRIFGSAFLNFIFTSP